MIHLPPGNDGSLRSLRTSLHPRCYVCSRENARGLGLQCAVMADGSVQGEFAGDGVYEGYVGWLHGGMIAALLDGAMTQCLFAHGCQAFTAELTVRYRHPVAASERLTVRAWLTESRAPLHVLRAELRQGNQLRAAARAKFMESPDAEIGAHCDHEPQVSKSLEINETTRRFMGSP